MRFFSPQRCQAGLWQIPRLGAYPLRNSARQFTSNRRLSEQSNPSTQNEELSRLLRSLIRGNGALNIPTYMALCLSHPTLGYYARRGSEVFGKRGDFITSPEISQVFGELLAVWFITQFTKQNPSTAASGGDRRISTRLIELGPGKGTLITDMMRTFSLLGKSVPNFSPPSSIHLVETSPSMKDFQRDTLSQWTKEDPKNNNAAAQLHWHDGIEGIPRAQEGEFTIAVAHEFFDALPVHIIQKTAEDTYSEVLVDLESSAYSQETPSPSPDPTAKTLETNTPTTSDSPTPPASAPSLRYVHSTTNASTFYPASKPDMFKQLAVGSRIEICPSAWSNASRLAELVSGSSGSGSGGAGLIVDYGDDSPRGDSFRAFSQHDSVDPLANPGNADLTANVDFGSLKEAVSLTAEAHGPLTQNQFLVSLGLVLRLKRLIQSADTEERKRMIASSGQRLVDPKGMGSEYKFMGITPKGIGGGWPFEEL